METLHASALCINNFNLETDADDGKARRRTDRPTEMCLLTHSLTHSRIFFAIRAHARKATSTAAARQRAIASVTAAAAVKDCKDDNDRAAVPPVSVTAAAAAVKDCKDDNDRPPAADAQNKPPETAVSKRMNE